MELLTEVFELGSEAKLTHFLFGSSPEVLARMEKQLAESFPDAEIAGSFSPPFGQLDEVDFAPAVAAIRAASPDIVWCGLGAPKQELWMQRHARQIAPAVVVGVGAAFDFAAGTKQRAPHWAQEHGVEWLHRLGSEPRRLIGRVRLDGLPVRLVRRRLAGPRPARAGVGVRAERAKQPMSVYAQLKLTFRTAVPDARPRRRVWSKRNPASRRAAVAQGRA